MLKNFVIKMSLILTWLWHLVSRVLRISVEVAAGGEYQCRAAHLAFMDLEKQQLITSLLDDVSDIELQLQRNLWPCGECGIF